MPLISRQINFTLMKKLVSILLTCFMFNSFAISQNCSLFEKGYNIRSIISNYSSDLPSSKGWSKKKPEKQAILIDEYNKNVLSGVTPAYSTTTIDMYIKDVERNDFEKITSAMMSNGVEYTFNSFCVNNINYFYRAIGPFYYVSNNDTLGAGFYGTQIIPNDLKVGQILTPYEDISTIIISTSNYTDKQRVLAGYRQVETLEKNATYLNKETYKYETGDWKVTKYEQLFEDVDVKVMENTSLNSHAIHYVSAVVDSVIDVQIDNKPHKAYIIESELWIQAAFETTFAADNAKWQKFRQGYNEKIQKKAMKKLIKSKFLNEDGFYVTYQTEWFVPGYGVVKIITYGSDGFISNIVMWDNLKVL